METKKQRQERLQELELKYKKLKEDEKKLLEKIEKLERDQIEEEVALE